MCGSWLEEEEEEERGKRDAGLAFKVAEDVKGKSLEAKRESGVGFLFLI